MPHSMKIEKTRAEAVSAVPSQASDKDAVKKVASANSSSTSSIKSLSDTKKTTKPAQDNICTRVVNDFLKAMKKAGAQIRKLFASAMETVRSFFKGKQEDLSKLSTKELCNALAAEAKIGRTLKASHLLTAIVARDDIDKVDEFAKEKMTALFSRRVGVSEDKNANELAQDLERLHIRALGIAKMLTKEEPELANQGKPAKA